MLRIINKAAVGVFHSGFRTPLKVSRSTLLVYYEWGHQHVFSGCALLVYVLIAYLYLPKGNITLSTKGNITLSTKGSITLSTKKSR